MIRNPLTVEEYSWGFFNLVIDIPVRICIMKPYGQERR